MDSDSLSEPPIPLQDSQANMVLRFSGSSPVVLPSPEQLDVELGSLRHGNRWKDWEKDMVFEYWVARQLSEARLEVAMSAGQTPCTENILSGEWHKVSRLLLH